MQSYDLTSKYFSMSSGAPMKPGLDLKRVQPSGDSLINAGYNASRPGCIFLLSTGWLYRLWISRISRLEVLNTAQDRGRRLTNCHAKCFLLQYINLHL